MTDLALNPPDFAELGRKLFNGECAFLSAAATTAQLPPPGPPEVAFAGRSNVGKSSLINALVNRKDLARASSEPGRTREVNFFDLGGRVLLADLPGYGFAKTARTTARKFQNLGRAYLRGRPNLKRAYLLIDARHGLKDTDAGVLATLDQAAVNYQLVLTKSDEVGEADRASLIAALMPAITGHPAAFPQPLR